MDIITNAKFIDGKGIEYSTEEYKPVFKDKSAIYEWLMGGSEAMKEPVNKSAKCKFI
jgi:hypothetical protein